MKTKLLLFSALSFVILCFNGCSPDEVVTAQAQFKPYVIRVTSSEPITPTTTDAQGFIYLNSLCLSATNYGSACINGSMPSTIGLNQVQLQGTVVENTPMNIEIQYGDAISYQTSGLAVGDCDQITLEIYFDGSLVYTEQRVMGGINCFNGVYWNLNYTF